MEAVQLASSRTAGAANIAKTNLNLEERVHWSKVVSTKNVLNVSYMWKAITNTSQIMIWNHSSRIAIIFHNNAVQENHSQWEQAPEPNTYTCVRMKVDKHYSPKWTYLLQTILTLAVCKNLAAESNWHIISTSEFSHSWKHPYAVLCCSLLFHCITATYKHKIRKKAKYMNNLLLYSFISDPDNTYTYMWVWYTHEINTPSIESHDRYSSKVTLFHNL